MGEDIDVFGKTKGSKYGENVTIYIYISNLFYICMYLTLSICIYLYLSNQSLSILSSN
jgi:hypothetical protein